MTIDVSKLPTIRLHSGNYFRFDDPENSPILIEDIAHALSHICRYGGHVPKFYSVAEHSILTSLLVPPELRLTALLHDATEAYIGDMVRPLKRIMPKYQEFEDRLERAISKQFGTIYPLPPVVKLADNQMLQAEKIQLFRTNDVWVPDVDPARINVLCLTSETAKIGFLECYAELVGGAQ